MTPVILESPYAGADPIEISINVKYAQLCMKHCINRGESPFASHLLYTQPNVLDDNLPEHRRFGLRAGFAWHELAKKVVVYTDLGITEEMYQGIENATRFGKPVEFRKLSPELRGKLSCVGT